MNFESSQRKRKSIAKPSTPKSRVDDQMLPQWEGPKLAPFKHRHPKIEFQALLNDIDSVEDISPNSGHGFVFKAMINSEPFALKVFKFFDIEEARSGFIESQNEQMSDEELTANADPFFAECRAYGRIQQFYKALPSSQRKKVIAVPCYGYLYLSSEFEAVIEKQFGSLKWNRQDTALDQPLRALVKEFISTNSPLDLKKKPVKSMLSDLKALRDIGIYPRDIHARNYRDGLLVDFGQAVTEPSCLFRVATDWVVRTEKKWDLGDFDAMMRELKVKTTVKAAPVPRSTRSVTNQKAATQEFLELDKSGKKASVIQGVKSWH